MENKKKFFFHSCSDREKKLIKIGKFIEFPGSNIYEFCFRNYSSEIGMKIGLCNISL